MEATRIDLDCSVQKPLLVQLEKLAVFKFIAPYAHKYGITVSAIANEMFHDWHNDIDIEKVKRLSHIPALQVVLLHKLINDSIKLQLRFLSEIQLK